MTMIFKNKTESARLLSIKLKDEFPDIIGSKKQNYLITFINQDSRNFAQLIAQKLKLEAGYLPGFILELTQDSEIKNLIIIDQGNTRASEFIEFTDRLRKKILQITLLIAIPIIPQSEETIFKNNCDSLITLHIEPLFFSTDQFYENGTAS